MKIKTLGLLSAAVAGVLLSVSGVKANTIQPIEVSAGTSGANFTYTYSVQLTPNNGLTKNATGNTGLGGDANQSGLVILDFPGVTSVSIASSGGDVTAVGDWGVGFSTGGGLSGSGLTLVNTSWAANIFTVTGFSTITSNDSPTVPNVILVYNGATVSPVAGQTNLIHLTITSTQALNLTGASALQSISRDTTAAVMNEVDTFPVTASVPLPAAAWAGLSTLGGMGALGLLRKRKA